MADTTIFLRPILESDVTDRYLDWFRDPLVTRFLEARDLSREEVIAFMREGRDETRFTEAVCIERTGLHVGNVKLDVNWRHSVGMLSIVIGDRDYWKQGIGTKAIQLMTDKAFNQLGIRKINGGLYAVNLGSLTCFERAGWRLEAIQRDHRLLDGMSVDTITMAIFNPGEWRTTPPAAFTGG